MSDSPKGFVRLFDDFLGKALDATNWWTTNSDSGGTAFAIDLAHNGTVIGSVDTTDNDITSLLGNVIWRADKGGPLSVEIRMKPITSVADGESFVGFTDAATDEMPIQVSTTDAQTDAATDAVGFCYTGAGTANWKACAVKADVSKTPVACSSGGVTTPVVGTYQTFKVVLSSEGHAYFYIDGKEQATIENAVTATVLLTPAVVLMGGGTARSLTVDYVDVRGGRAA